MNTYEVKPLAHREKKPEERTTSGCLVAHKNPYSSVTEQYRTIRNNIRYSLEKKRVGALVVTSASEGEGKSTVAVNLAICFAQQGDRVLLVDANLRSPILNHVFNIKSWPGLTDGLAYHIDILESIQQTDIGRLSVLPSGSSLHNAADLLDSQAMTVFLEIASERFDTILFDCSSVLDTPDASALASRCNGAILVINNGKTDQKKALEAKKMLEFGNVRIVGAVLNKKKR